jgi:hypothetical protein
LTEETLTGQQIQKDNLYLMNQIQVMVVPVWGKVVPELTGANVAFAVRARVVLASRFRFVFVTR